MARKIKKSAGEIKSRWQLMRRGRIALGFGALLIAGLLASVALADSGVPGITSSGSTDTTTAAATDTSTGASSGTTDTGTTTTAPTDTSSTTTAPTTTTTTTTTTTPPSSAFAPTVSSDQADYAPGSTVTLTGHGWVAGEAVHLFVNDNIGQTWSYSADVTADSTGSFTNQLTLPTTFIATYSVTATGTISGTATTTFTDGNIAVQLATADNTANGVAGFTWSVNWTQWQGTGNTVNNNCSGAGTAHTTTYTVNTPDSGGQNMTPQANSNASAQVTGAQATGSFASNNVFAYWTLTQTGTQANAVTPGCVAGQNGSGTLATYYAHFKAADSTAPVITPNVSGTLGNNGWYTSNVTVSWTVNDPESTVTSSTGCGTSSVTTDTAGQTFTCQATSAGGTSSQSVTVKRDATAPTITFTNRTPAANANGWNNTDVTVNWSCSDALSGAVNGTTSQTITTEGSNQSTTGTCTDNAGNTSSDTQSGIKIDKTKPTISAAATKADSTPYTSGTWTNQTVTVHFTCNDGGSGFAAGACPSDVVVSSNTAAAGQDVSGTVTDQAGNTSAATGTINVKVDKAAPTITPSTRTQANLNGWNNTDVTVSWTCADALSGPVSPSVSQTVTAEGANQSVNGTCTDNAGNSASNTQADINIDKTAPAISFSGQSPAANGNGWNNSDVTLSWTCSDGLSGALNASVSSTITTEGSNLSGTGTCFDKAGNSASNTHGGVKIDKTAPTITFSSRTAANSNGWNNTDVTVSWSCADSLSGTASPSVTQTISTEGAGQSATGTCADAAGNSASNTQTGINIDKTNPTISFTNQSPAANSNGWNNSDVTLNWSCSDSLSGAVNTTLSASITTEGSNQSSSATCFDKAGNSASNSHGGVNIDKTAPVITNLGPTTSPNGAGWYNHDVTNNFKASDALAGLGTSCDISFPLNGANEHVQAATTSGEGVGVKVTSASCTDAAGNTASGIDSAGFNIDKTAPSASTSLDRGADHNGWYNHPVDWHTTGSDATSGIASCSSGTFSGPDGSGKSVSGTCTDNAGNVSDVAASALFDYDATAPTGVATALQRSADHNGWYNHAVGWTTTGTDATSGIDSCSSGTYSGPDGTGKFVNGQCVDNAGNPSAYVDSAPFDYDATAPTGVATVLQRAADHNGWYNHAVDWTTTGTDATSGIDSCSSGTYSGPDGAAKTVSGSCTDKAGNTSGAAVSVAFDYDATAPSASTSLGRGADHNGWYNHAVGWTTSGTDATSGIDSCSSGTYSGPDGTGKTVSGSCTDKAGNPSGAAVSAGFDYDATAPSASTSLGRGADHNGWYNHAVDWTTTGTDATSGIDSCSSGSYSGPEGTGKTVSGTCTDKAGNTSDAAVSAMFQYDATAPTGVATALQRPADHNGWYNHAVDWKTTGSDAVSGIDSCSFGTYSGPDTTGQFVNGQCVDKAGNPSAYVDSAPFNYDATAPANVATSLGRGADLNGWYNHPVDWTTSGTDATSGIDSCSGGTYSGPDGTGKTVSGTCTDNAGNTSGAAASAAFQYDATAPTGVATALQRAADHNGWYNHPVDWKTTGSDPTSGIDTCSSGTYSGPEGTGKTVSGSCTDMAGNTSAAVASPAFQYDATAPTGVATALQRPADHNGWYNAAVAWKTSGTDATSGIDTCSAGTYSGPDGTGLTVSGSCTDVAGNASASAASDPFKYDATKPSLAPSVTPNPVLLNGSATAAANATDATSLIDSANTGCDPVATASPGPHTVACHATDNAGNTNTASATYTVSYNFIGFLPPLNSDTTIVNTGNAGKTYPVKWQLKDANGNYVTDAVAGTTVKTQTISCTDLSTSLSDPIDAAVTGSTSLRYDSTSNQYIYNWATPSTKNTCYKLTVTPPSGIVHIALFKLT